MKKEPKLLTIISFVIFNILGVMVGLLIGVQNGWITFVK